MGKARILYIGEEKTYSEYVKGNVPSHWFYGAVEMERDGHEVIWCQEKPGFFNDLCIIKKHKHDKVFIPNLNLRNHVLLLILSSIGIYRKPIYAYVHRSPKFRSFIKGRLYKLLFGGLRHAFFLSEKSMNDCINDGLLNSESCSVPCWGPDMNFYQNLNISDSGCFVSTGKENRDFDVIVEAFRITGEPLRIYTVPSNYSSHYEYLKEKCKNIPNIEVIIMENTPKNYPMMVTEMAKARALVCPLRKEKLHYCVGLSTIADAEGLGKPLILTKNPYHDKIRISDNVIQVETVDDWISAIKDISSVFKSKSACSMNAAYKRMKNVMGL